VTRFQAKEFALTLPQQAGTERLDVLRVVNIIKRRSAHTATIVVVEELHKSGKKHWHAFIRAKIGETFDFVGNKFRDSSSGKHYVLNFASTKNRHPAGWVRYIMKTIIKLKRATTEQQCLEVEHLRDQNKFDIVRCIDGEWQRQSLYSLWQSLQNHQVLDLLTESESPGAALRAVADHLRLGDMATIRAAANIIAAHKALHTPGATDEWRDTYVAEGERRPISDRIAGIMYTIREWFRIVADPTHTRVPLLIIDGPTKIGKTSTVFNVAPPGTTYCSENWTVSAFRSSKSGVVVLDDLNNYWGGGSREVEGGPLREPPKSWTQRGDWLYSEKYHNPSRVPCRGVVIISNARPGWSQSPYWTQNCTFIHFGPNEFPLWMDEGEESRAWLAARAQPGHF